MRFTNRFCDPQVVHKTYHEHLDEWALCEDLGFDGAFVNEHHFTAINIQPSCNITATAIMMRTKRMKVGVIGNILPLRHPVQTAEEFAMMDCLSGGRFIAGIVRLVQCRSLHQPRAAQRILRNHSEVSDGRGLRL